MPKRPKSQVLSVAELGCAYVLNPCNKTLLRPLPGSTFELVPGLAPNPGTSMPLPRFAQLHDIALKTLHNRISRGELTEEDGLEKRRGHWLVTDPVRLGQAIGCSVASLNE